MRAWLEAFRALHLVWVAAFSLLIPLLGGIWLDRRYESAPCLTIVGMVLGVTVAVYTVVREVSRSYCVASHKKLKNGRKEDQT